jgi:hypothetical protein
MEKVYTLIDWENAPNTSTPLGRTNLRKVDYAVNVHDDRIIAMDTAKANQSTVNNVVKEITYEESTGILTITKVNNTSTQIDTKLEKLAVNFSYDPETEELIITLDDGTEQRVDLSALITQYEFIDTDTVSFLVQADGKIKAEVIDGSITADKLEPNYLADIIVQANIAVANADKSKRYAVGGVESGDTTDNAKYYKEQAELAKIAAEQARDEAESIVGVGIATDSAIGLVKGNGNVSVKTDGAMWADQYKDKGTATGTSVQFTNADDALIAITTISGTGSVTLVATGKNLFNKNETYTHDKALASSTGAENTNTSSDISPYIKVNPASGYSLNLGSWATTRVLCFYDINKSFISGISGTSVYNFTTPSTAHYVRFNFSETVIGSVQLEIGSATAYEAYKGNQVIVPDVTTATYPIYLTSYKDITNVFTLSTSQPSFTVNAKAKLWSDIFYIKNNVGGDMFKSTYDPNNKNTDAFNSENQVYDNTTSGLSATNAQAAIDEVSSAKVTKGDLVINVKDYGAVGNGLTNDTTAFVNAMSALESQNGGVLIVHSGTYLIQSIIYVPSNVSIIGYGQVVIKRNSDIQCVFLGKSDGTVGGYGAIKNIKIENIVFDGAQSTFVSNCGLFACSHATDIHIKNCTFQNLDGWHMIELNATKHSLIENCTFNNYGYGNAGATASEMVQLDYSFSSGFPWYGPYDNTSCKDITIRNNTFTNSIASAIGNHSFLTGIMLSNIKILENRFENIEGQTIKLSDINTLQICKNEFLNAFYGIYFVPQQNDSYDILIEDNTYEGLRLSQPAGADSRFIGLNPTNVTAYNINNVKIIHNTVSNSLRHAIGLKADYAIIENNYISGSNNNGIYFFGGYRGIISNNTLVYNNLTASGGGDLVLGYNTSKAVSELLVSGNRIQTLIVGTNVTTATTLIQNNMIDVLSTSPTATVKNNVINGTWTAG